MVHSNKVLVGLLASLAFVVAEDYVCPAGQSSTSVSVGAGDALSFFTNEAGDKYTGNVNCKVTYEMADTCKQLLFDCEEFSLGKGDFLAVSRQTKKGVKTKKFKNKKFKVQKSNGDISVLFKSNKKKNGDGAFCYVECSKAAPGVTTTTSGPGSSSTEAPTTTTSGPIPPNVSQTQKSIMDDIVAFWRQFRDPQNGFWCDYLSLNNLVPCGAQNNFYSAAGTGMGLVTEAIMVELGYQTREEATARLVQTLNNLLTIWPRETFSGFLVHFTNRNMDALSEFSTIDTTIAVLGALVMNLASQLKDATQWSDAIRASNNPDIYPVVDPNTGVLSGTIRPYNEYYLVAYLANVTSAAGSKSNTYFETYYGTSGAPVGDGNYPVAKNYWGYDLLTDQPRFVASFIPLFNAYLSKGYLNNQYYMDLNTRWLKADKLFWSKALGSSGTIWGNLVQNITWGAGAGIGPSGYSVEKIDSSSDLIISGAIMAGFLPFADTDQLRQEINDQLETMYNDNICAYQVTLPSGDQTKIIWRCSARLSDWRAPRAESIDFSTMILGYSTNFLTLDFFNRYTA